MQQQLLLGLQQQQQQQQQQQRPWRQQQQQRWVCRAASNELWTPGTGMLCWSRQSSTSQCSVGGQEAPRLVKRFACMHVCKAMGASLLCLNLASVMLLCALVALC
jgi:hypothetical protein